MRIRPSRVPENLSEINFIAFCFAVSNAEPIDICRIYSGEDLVILGLSPTQCGGIRTIGGNNLRCHKRRRRVRIRPRRVPEFFAFVFLVPLLFRIDAEILQNYSGEDVVVVAGSESGVEAVRRNVSG